jgi:hypothetical protein
MMNVLYYDLQTKEIRVCNHIWFDEGMRDVAEKPPNARILETALGAAPLDSTEFEACFPELETTFNPFSRLLEVTIPVTCDLPLLGLTFATCSQHLRAYVSEFARGLSASKLGRPLKNQLSGSYVVNVGDPPPRLYCRSG